jgi:hypothetical protein
MQYTIPPVRRIVADVEAMPDPDQRWRAAHDVEQWARSVAAEMYMVRARTARGWAEEGHSFGEIAGWYGLARATVQHLVELAQGRRTRSGGRRP